RELWVRVYEALTTAPPGLMGAIHNRAAPHVRRIAMIYAVMDRSAVVTEGHLAAALAFWDYCSRSAKFVFGESTGERVADDLLECLQGAPQGLPRTELSNAMGRHVTSSVMSAALLTLERYGWARRELEETGGRPAERWRAIRGRTP